MKKSTLDKWIGTFKEFGRNPKLPEVVIDLLDEAHFAKEKGELDRAEILKSAADKRFDVEMTKWLMPELRFPEFSKKEK